ncbi:restriction endonuclease, type II, LlaJI,LlaJI restriction endonuclease [[Clostridium] sordellii]|uniref:LlaJI family restriction endonuclease n=1 Tax=Paraclostridium sordellii TaxID=1505 RepID=UPI0005442226|nr:LlaJI family restriction endonuclease [Paeniclostridium sordellii]CEK34509.1 restriction endonuclease, type II, LlaJI,LlaJI restriction endonuclease [[Clostridium] sordellii] [Paeniclostridium sordellii]
MKLNNDPIYVREEYSYKLKNDGTSNELPFTSEEIKSLIDLRICDKFDKDTKLKFKFVGIITLQNDIVISLPKSYTNDKTNVMPDIIKSFKAYKNSASYKRNKKTSINENTEGELYLNDNLNDCSISEISIADYIISDYINYGLYQNFYSELILDGNGDPDWQTTVERIDPIMSNGYPIYTSTYNYEIFLDRNNKITELHKWAVDYSIGKYAKFLDYNLDIVYGEYESYEDIGSYNEILYLIQSELNNTFESRKIDLLKALNNLLNRSFGSTNGDSISLYGTSKFDTIWEYILQTVFKDEYYHEDFKDKYNRDIFKPLWNDINGNPWQANPIKPDIVRQVDKDLFILDAKYYDIELNYNKDGKLQLSGQPDSYDIIKQTYYKTKLEEAFNKSSTNDIHEYINCFVYPKRNPDECDYSIYESDKAFDEAFTILGIVSIGEIIINIQVSPNYLLHRFKSDSPFSNEEMNKLKLKIITEASKLNLDFASNKDK